MGVTTMKNTIETLAPWMPKAEAEIIIDDLADIDRRRLWGPWLGRKELKLSHVTVTTADRERLKAWHIPPMRQDRCRASPVPSGPERTPNRNAKRREAGVEGEVDL